VKERSLIGFHRISIKRLEILKLKELKQRNNNRIKNRNRTKRFQKKAKKNRKGIVLK
jgi:hypothetical protein